MNFKLIDLSYPIDHTIKIYPGDSPAYLIQEKYFETDEFNTFRLEIGLHTGTHIDAPMHLTDNKKFINDYELNCFCGNAVLLDVRGENLIQFKKHYDNIVKENSIVLFFTGHESQYETPEYFTDHPVLDMSLAEFLVTKKIKMAGMDLPSPDRPPYFIHKKLLENGIMIIENLRNLTELINHEFEIFAFPLNIKSDSSLVRAVAKIQIR